MKLTIGWLYPKQMSTYGDRGDILTIYQRCLWRGINVEVMEIGLKENVTPGAVDFYFFGGGQDSAQIEVAKDLQRYKKKALKEAAEEEAVFLSICGGYQLLGHYYKPHDGVELPGVGIIDVFTISGDKRMIGNIMIESNVIIPQRNIVGFENHSGKTFLGKNALSLGRVIIGNGNNGEDRTEGAIQKNVFGCYLHGPVLPKNPGFADFLIEKALGRKHPELKLKPLDDSLEILANESAAERTRKNP
ncbi:MAG: glutamine amidotransferase [Candidatus Woykebacteria bacterium]